MTMEEEEEKLLSSIAATEPQNGEAAAASTTDDSDSDEEAGRQGDSSAVPGGVGYEISEESKAVRERQERAMQQLLMKRRASALAVPTNDNAVRTRLRRLGEPMTLFGEREMERRDRLRMILAKLDAGQLETLIKAHEEDEASAANAQAPDDSDFDQVIEYPFYTEALRPKALRDARIHIANYSMTRAALRLQRARRKEDDPDEDMDAEINWALQHASNLKLDCSEIGDDRPLSGCSFSQDGNLLATWYLPSTTFFWVFVFDCQFCLF